MVFIAIFLALHLLIEISTVLRHRQRFGYRAAKLNALSFANLCMILVMGAFTFTYVYWTNYTTSLAETVANSGNAALCWNQEESWTNQSTQLHQTLNETLTRNVGQLIASAQTG